VSGCDLNLTFDLDGGEHGRVFVAGSDSLRVVVENWSAAQEQGIVMSYGPNASPPEVSGKFSPEPVLDLDEGLYCDPIVGDDDDDDSGGDDDDDSGDDDSGDDDDAVDTCACSTAAPPALGSVALFGLLLVAGRRLRLPRSRST
jgi:MYXO-CTERM domain-containing protein